MKKLIALVLVALMSLSMIACGNNDEQLAAMQKEIDALKNSDSTDANGTAAQTREYVYALNSTIDGETTVAISEKSSLEVQAVIPEGMVVDYWTVDGKAQENTSGETYKFDAQTTAIVEPVFRAEKKVTAINAEMRFVDADRKPAGEAFTEFVFEDEYTNTATNEKVSDGSINVEVKAVIPAGKMVDYWLINGVKYYYGAGVSSFVVEQLDEATTYEVVFKDIPVTYYTLTCSRCNWKGKATASVIGGSTITINCNSGMSGKFYVNGAKVTGDYVTSVTITINSNTTVEFYETIN